MDDLITPYTKMTGNNNHGWRATLTPSWIDLAVAFPHPPGVQRRVVGEGLDLTLEVRAMVSGWFRSVDGQWLAVCHYQIPYADGRKHMVALRNQVVPGHAMRHREDNLPTGR
ncbi:hypothetical protein [Allokutzneria sp. NRRL B-24872]|uniref:hypothetical protein n=1 Tax=Allokutzneria sp. NRRL B-24872 TaxID=1137961 RepID=UPI001178711F|nr:hypothetical protein [Allokutzneria sp. NRRL B-24872]